jgi:hypothetical protein
MGYQITITRAEEDSDDGLIPRDEWLSFAASDPELTVQDANEKFPAVTWKNGNNSAELFWEEAGVWASSPENNTILKMVEIATKLSLASSVKI